MRGYMIQSFTVKPNTELFVTDNCVQMVFVDLPPLPGWVTIGNMYVNSSILVYEDEWDSFVELINAVNVKVQEVKRGNKQLPLLCAEL